MTKAYQAFLAEPLTYTISPDRRSYCLTVSGARADIERFWTGLCNLDGTRPLTYIKDDRAYMTCQLKRLKAAIKLHLYLGIMMNREVDVLEVWTEGAEDEPGEYQLNQDTVRADELAEAEATDWMERLESGALSVRPESDAARTEPVEIGS